MTNPFAWSVVLDADYVERGILALQAAIAEKTPTSAVEDDEALYWDDTSQRAANATVERPRTA
jgi:hypothetical protein